MSTVAYIHPDACDRSPVCPAKRMCPQGAIGQEKGKGMLSFLSGGPLRVDTAKCTGCAVCAQYCRKKAITMVKAQ